MACPTLHGHHMLTRKPTQTITTSFCGCSSQQCPITAFCSCPLPPASGHAWAFRLTPWKKQPLYLQNKSLSHLKISAYDTVPPKLVHVRASLCPGPLNQKPDCASCFTCCDSKRQFADEHPWDVGNWRSEPCLHCTVLKGCRAIKMHFCNQGTGCITNVPLRGKEHV